ncbi:small ribosomal subunit protein uS14m [Planococcus citri]|uniref:small ribosomal subunit protein uS14m n=1 Tax=Planococcus citri TaxID=170843 RepID=UPI0031F8690F
MSLFGQLVQNCFKMMESKIAVGSSIILKRNKHHQLPYFGAKNNWPQWSMMKDQRKRMTLKEYGRFKLRLNAMRKTDLLPPELKEIANHEIATVPRDAAIREVYGRCAITSRGRGNVVRWKVSRIIFKQLADYNKLAGIMRARW